jgi:hypothetical protein
MQGLSNHQSGTEETAGAEVARVSPQSSVGENINPSIWTRGPLIDYAGERGRTNIVRLGLSKGALPMLRVSATRGAQDRIARA